MNSLKNLVIIKNNEKHPYKFCPPCFWKQLHFHAVDINNLNEPWKVLKKIAVYWLYFGNSRPKQFIKLRLDVIC